MCLKQIYSEIVASKKFHTFQFFNYLINLILINMYKNDVKLVIFESSYLYVVEMAKINADEYFLSLVYTC